VDAFRHANVRLQLLDQSREIGLQVSIGSAKEDLASTAEHGSLFGTPRSEMAAEALHPCELIKFALKCGFRVAHSPGGSTAVHRRTGAAAADGGAQEGLRLGLA